MKVISTISIIIPILNEADNLPRLFENIASLTPLPTQILLVDGGSADGSMGVAQALMDTVSNSKQSTISGQVIESTAGRATQMNAGAVLATGDILLFLHADTQLPKTAIYEIVQSASKAEWGRFDVRLDSDDPMLWLVSQMMNGRSRVTGIATGDQAIFVKKSLFEHIGGYPNQPLMEDIELCKRLKSIAKPLCLKHKVSTSPRRWQRHGTWRTIRLMWHLRFDYWRGVSAESIKQRYDKS